MQEEIVEVDVGGVRYSLSIEDIEKHHGSFFECMIKKEWTSGNKVISIARDGKVFKYVYAFLVCGHLPRDRNGQIVLDAETLEAVKLEADFFGLEALSNECNQIQKTTVVSLQSYMTIRKFIDYVKDNTQDLFEVEYAVKNPHSNLLRVLSEVWCPFCITGTIYSYMIGSRELFKSSTFNNLNIEELLAHATQSAFGHGTETVTDTTVRNSFEILASELDASSLTALQKAFDLKEFAPHRKIELRPYKLVIYKEGGHFDAHRDTVRGNGHIGTLVIVLNSEYTGGELEVSHSGRTETVTGSYRWVAMYGDCLHKINPVTSGTRVSLIYDIYSTDDVVPPRNTIPEIQTFTRTMLSRVAADPLAEYWNPGAPVVPPVTTTVTVTYTAEGIVSVQPVEPSADTVETEHTVVSHSVNNTNSNNTNINTSRNTTDEKNSEESSSSSSSESSNAVYSTTSDEIEEEQEVEDWELANAMHTYDPDTPSVESDYWNQHKRYPQQSVRCSTLARGIDNILSARIVGVLNTEFRDWEVIIITLQHLYPECQSSPAFLKGGDRALYDLLSEQYDVQVVAATIQRRFDPEYSGANSVQGCLFSPAIVESALHLHNADSIDVSTDGLPYKKRRLDLSRTKLVIPNLLNCDHVLDYSPYVSYTGNDSQAEETVYIVACLQVRMKL